MSESEIWEAIRQLQQDRKVQAARIDELERWVERLSKASQINSDNTIATFDLIRSQIQLARKNNDLN